MRQALRISWRVTAIVALVAISALASLATDYKCNPGQNSVNCQYNASCEGFSYRWVTACSIQCYEATGNAGEIVEAGSASCGAPEGDCTGQPRCGPLQDG